MIKWQFESNRRNGQSGVRRLPGAVAVLALVLAGGGGPVAAKDANTGGRIQGEEYTPTIWIDPDGCEHWVMDDGWEGFMTPHLTRDGKPVCHQGNTCASLNSDQLFASGSARIGPNNRQRLLDFFKKADARAFIINGHTDSRASDAYNMRLSERRAAAVARIAGAAGAEVLAARGYGERLPKAPNNTSAGMAENRRVEIICVH